mgnify:CR=1 FL=1
MFHPLSVHFPIALLIVATVFKLLAFFFKNLVWQEAGSYLLYVGIVTCWIAIYTGDLADGAVGRTLCDPTVLKDHEKFKALAEKYMDAPDFLYLGRGYSFPVALEGALKLKEISYIHAEGYPAAEMKHGPIALIDEEMPVFVIATKGASYDKVVSNIQEVKARKGRVISVITEGDELIAESETEQAVSWFFVLSHGYDTESGSTPGRVH